MAKNKNKKANSNSASAASIEVDSGANAAPEASSVPDSPSPSSEMISSEAPVVALEDGVDLHQELEAARREISEMKALLGEKDAEIADLKSRAILNAGAPPVAAAASTEHIEKLQVRQIRREVEHDCNTFSINNFSAWHVERVA